MTDFYVGYLPKAPTALVRFLRRIIVLLGLVAITVAFVLLTGQMPFAKSAFEYGKMRKFEGIIEARPYPTLLVERPGEASNKKEEYSRYLLVAPGKHGADRLVGQFDGTRVRLEGQLIHRNNATMIEVAVGSVTPLDTTFTSQAPTVDLGPATLTGEIVDGKCYLGVMNPGNGKVHRDCAARCISGGIPPIFVTLNGEDQFLLVGLDGKAIQPDMLLEFVAEPLTIRGELIQKGESRLLEINVRELHHTPDRVEAVLR
jgi:hypothetical protein